MYQFNHFVNERVCSKSMSELVNKHNSSEEEAKDQNAVLREQINQLKQKLKSMKRNEQLVQKLSASHKSIEATLLQKEKELADALMQLEREKKIVLSLCSKSQPDEIQVIQRNEFEVM